MAWICRLGTPKPPNCTGELAPSDQTLAHTNMINTNPKEGTPKPFNLVYNPFGRVNTYELEDRHCRGHKEDQAVAWWQESSGSFLQTGV